MARFTVIAELKSLGISKPFEISLDSNGRDIHPCLLWTNEKWLQVEKSIRRLGSEVRKSARKEPAPGAYTEESKLADIDKGIDKGIEKDTDKYIDKNTEKDIDKDDENIDPQIAWNCAIALGRFARYELALELFESIFWASSPGMDVEDCMSTLSLSTDRLYLPGKKGVLTLEKDTPVSYTVAAALKLARLRYAAMSIRETKREEDVRWILDGLFGFVQHTGTAYQEQALEALQHLLSRTPSVILLTGFRDGWLLRRFLESADGGFVRTATLKKVPLDFRDNA